MRQRRMSNNAAVVYHFELARTSFAEERLDDCKHNCYRVLAKCGFKKEGLLPELVTAYDGATDLLLQVYTRLGDQEHCLLLK